MTELIIAVGFAIIVSAGCSMFEAVLYSVPLRHLESMIRSGRKSGIIFKKLVTWGIENTPSYYSKNC